MTPRKGKYIKLSNECFEALRESALTMGYKGTQSYQGTGAYLRALIEANPNVSDWTDARPDYMRDTDYTRIKRGAHTLWGRQDDLDGRVSRWFSQETCDALAPLVEQMRWEFAIAVRATPGARMAHVLTAIALGYLQPRRAAPPTKIPTKPRSPVRKRFELVF